MTKVLQFGMSSNYGGIESFIMNYYRVIDRTKIQFDFAKSNNHYKIAYEDEILSLGGKIYCIPSTSIKSGYSRLRKAWHDFYNSIEVDEIHFNTIALTNMYAIRFAKECGVHAHVHAHPSAYDTDFSLWVKFRMRYNRKAVHKYADTLLACSDPAGKWMFGTDFKVIPNAIVCDKFKYDLNYRDLIRKQYHITDAFVLLNVARLSSVKNQIFLLKVLKEIKKYRNNAKLVLVGGDTLNGALQKKAKEMQIDEAVIFTGMVQQPEQFYSAAEVLVFPSISEGFGIVPIEAQANGLRVFVADTLIKDLNVTGTLRYLPIVDINEQKAAEIWAKAILENSERLNEDCIKAVYASYDIKNTIKTLEEIYLAYE